MLQQHLWEERGQLVAPEVEARQAGQRRQGGPRHAPAAAAFDAALPLHVYGVTILLVECILLAVLHLCGSVREYFRIVPAR